MDYVLPKKAKGRVISAVSHSNSYTKSSETKGGFEMDETGNIWYDTESNTVCIPHHAIIKIVYDKPTGSSDKDAN